jgi:hypothetical protein
MAGCNHSPELIFDYKDVNYYAADEYGGREFNGNLIINLTKDANGKAASNAYNIPQLAKHMAYRPEEIVLGWQDFGSPPVKASFWQAIHAYAKSKKYTDVCFHCQQGHGRTGTALAAMMIANVGVKAVDAITDIRSRYCKSAVESDSQLHYLLSLDEEVNERPAPTGNDMEDFLDTYNPKMKYIFKSKDSVLHPDHNDNDSDDYMDLRTLLNSGR